MIRIQISISDNREHDGVKDFGFIVIVINTSYEYDKIVEITCSITSL